MSQNGYVEECGDVEPAGRAEAPSSGRPVDEAIDQVFRGLDRAMGIVDELRGRLGPVLASPQPKSERTNPTPDIPGDSEITQKLVEMKCRIEHLINGSVDILERLEL